ncbi:MAG TPA: methionyl-tRNA formyltransferase [Polyangia bacterium]|jgi:methionyl-tRNA formyltransferase
MGTRGGKPRAIFFGSPAFAVPCLAATAEAAELVAVVSQPDRPAGRGNQLTPPAVKVAAARLDVPVLQPEKIRPPEFEATLRSFAADVFVVVAYGRILPQALLDLPRLGPWNVHASLLPSLRGAAPIQWSIIGGDARTGVSIMRMEAGLDTGPVAAVADTAIADDDTSATLSARLSALGAALLARTLPVIAAGVVTLQRQDDAAATLAPLLKKEDGHLDFTRPARAVSARARGVDPWPGAFALFDGQPLKLFGPRVLAPGAGGAPGTVGGASADGLIVACGDGSVSFAEVQLPGRKRLPAAAVLAGQPALATAVLR